MAADHCLRWSEATRHRERPSLTIADVGSRAIPLVWVHEPPTITPATAEAIAFLSRERQSRREIGDAFLFPARRGDTAKPMSGDAVFNLWKRLAIAAKLPSGERFGWHTLRRKFASDLRRTNLKDLKDLGGWKSVHTLLTCYINNDEDSQRTALEERSKPRKRAIS